jgi:mRNA interferase RelE/StbE
MFLGDWEGYWRLRVGEFRVIYKIDDRAAQVTILRIRHRSEAYEGGPDTR